jgi:hypothetical protein
MRSFAQIKCERFVQDRPQDVSEIRIGFMTGHAFDELSFARPAHFEWDHACLDDDAMSRKEKFRKKLLLRPSRHKTAY